MDRTSKKSRSTWLWVIVGMIVLAIIGVIAYMALYNGSGYSSGTTSGVGGGGGGGGGGYLILALSADQLRRISGWIRSKR